MASAWVYQDAKMVGKHVADAASWYVGRYNLEGKRPPGGPLHAGQQAGGRDCRA